MDTIFAQATAPGRAGISVVRVSGTAAFDVAHALTGYRPMPRRASLRILRCPRTTEVIDQALVVGFKGAQSFTGEDTVELQLHGSIAVVKAVLDCLTIMENLRPAEPGEFTRRALLHGKLDLAQVEGLADLVVAETDAQRRQALGVMRGSVSNLASSWRADLVDALAIVEASIDFGDEDIPADLVPHVLPLLNGMISSMRQQADGSAMAERIREGFEVALVGPPNTGKSTLLNALAGRDVALTSEIAGTTRDIIEVRMDLRGLPVTVLDTAGLRGTTDRLEGMGVSRAVDRATRADLRIFLVEDTNASGLYGILEQPEDIVVQSKADLGRLGTGLPVSGLTGAGVEQLIAVIAGVLEKRAAAAGSITTSRQRVAIERALGAIVDAATSLGETVPQPELAADALQRALRALDFLIGKVDVESVLDVIFQNFCLGK